MFDIADFWANILSEEPERTRQAFWSLPNEDERRAVLDHLRRMATEPDWAEVQRQAARAALRTLSPGDAIS